MTPPRRSPRSWPAPRAGLLTLLAATAVGGGAAAQDSAVPAPVETAAQAALGVPGARLALRRFQAARGCAVQAAEIERPIAASGRYPVKVQGAGCRGWGWLEVTVLAPTLVTTRALRAGEPLVGAVTKEERELRPGREPVTSVEGARASRPLGRGQLLERSHLEEEGQAAGASIKVEVRAGALAVVQSGRVVPCGRGRTCAVMPSGKHVEGRLVEGRLLVETP